MVRSCLISMVVTSFFRSMVHDSLIICLYTFYPPAPQIATIKCRKVSRLSVFSSAEVREASKKRTWMSLTACPFLVLIYFFRLSMKQAAAETASAAPQKQNGAFVARLRQVFRAGELFPLRRERHISRDGDRFARVIHLFAVLPADEGIAGSRFFAKRHRLAVVRRFRPRFAVQQNICDRERPASQTAVSVIFSVTVMLTFPSSPAG